MAEAQFCSKCGAVLFSGDGFCVNCGLARPESPPETSAAQTSQQTPGRTLTEDGGYFREEELQGTPRRTLKDDEGYFTNEELGLPPEGTPQQPLGTVTRWEQSVEFSPMDEPQDISQESEGSIPESLESPEAPQPAPVGSPAGGPPVAPAAAGGFSSLPIPLPIIAGVVITLAGAGGFVALSGGDRDDQGGEQVQQSSLCQGENPPSICPDDEGSELPLDQDDDDDDDEDDDDQSIQQTCERPDDDVTRPLPFDKLYVQAPGLDGAEAYSLDLGDDDCDPPTGAVELTGEFDDILVQVNDTVTENEFEISFPLEGGSVEGEGFVEIDEPRLDCDLVRQFSLTFSGEYDGAGRLEGTVEVDHVIASAEGSAAGCTDLEGEAAPIEPGTWTAFYEGGELSGFIESDSGVSHFIAE